MAELNALQKNDGNSENTLLAAQQRCLEMLMACISQVEMRLPDQRNVFSELVALSPDVVLNQVRGVDFGKLPYQHLMGEDSNKIEEEYRQMIHINWKEELPDGVIPTDIESFWLQVRQMRWSDPDDAKFAALANHALSCLSVPSSNATVERLFSTVTFIKNKLCNRMSLKTLDTVTRIRTTLYFQSKCCKDFSVTERMFQLFTTENMYQFDEERNRNTISEGEERQEDDCGLLSLFEDL